MFPAQEAPEQGQSQQIKSGCGCGFKRWSGSCVLQLVRLDVDCYLLLDPFSVRKAHMQQDHPASLHVQVKACFIPARSDLLALAEHRSHARMRHVSFHCDTRAAQWLRGGVLQGDYDSFTT